MKNVPPGMTNFFRGFYYMKSADFPGNQNLPPLHPVWSAPVTGLTRKQPEKVSELLTAFLREGG
jgi:hypothetical protein